MRRISLRRARRIVLYNVSKALICALYIYPSTLLGYRSIDIDIFEYFDGTGMKLLSMTVPGDVSHLQQF